MKKLIILFVIFLILNKVNAQSTYWKSTSASPTPNYGEANLSIAIGTSNTIFVGTLKDGILKSTNNGDSWSLSLACYDTAIIKIISRGNSELFAIGRNAFYRTTNNGDTWERNVVPTNFTLTDIEVLSDGKIIVSTAEVVDVTETYYDYFGDGIFISDDHGKNWSQINNGINFNKAITNIAVGPNDILVASMASTIHNVGNLYYSLNKGSDWIIMPKPKFAVKSGIMYSPTSLYEIYCIEFDNDGYLYMSYEGVDGAFSMQGGLKNTFARAINNLSWIPYPINRLGYEWDYHPFYSLHFAKKQKHIYASLNTFASVSFGGNYILKENDTAFVRKVSGTYPVLDSYLKLIYAENEDGRIYAIQIYDHSVYYTDSSSGNPSSIIPIPKNNIDVNVFPNPATDLVNIQLHDIDDVLMEISILDLSGRVIHQELNINNNAFSIETSFLKAGLYIVSIKSKSGVSQQKLLIE